MKYNQELKCNKWRCMMYGFNGTILALLMLWGYATASDAYDNSIAFEVKPGDVILTPSKNTYVARFAKVYTHKEIRKDDGAYEGGRKLSYFPDLQVFELNAQDDCDNFGCRCYGIQSTELTVNIEVGSKVIDRLYIN